MGRKKHTLEVILSKSVLDTNTGCLLGTFVKDKDGYCITAVNGRKMPAHRAVMSFLTDVSGKYVLHKCNNPSCINPEHLYLGTQKDNIKDQIANGTNTGTNRVTAKLNVESIKEIRSSNLTIKELSEKYNVSYCCIWDIVNFRSWKNV